ncbi:hypothetical protein AJ80_08459 [Polytolypa hystricis UAMH7299]|uniref:Respiratory complex assembly protein Rmp1 n=1 Tax=Polytolypa hystricis (strain UAMH7299) TaxID=1447883 RepID=A0A2B7X7J9_POLH7|nr:hypothetical protein AJ80_08459 [Polytolypa hystricis UAMH7299]
MFKKLSQNVAGSLKTQLCPSPICTRSRQVHIRYAFRGSNPTVKHGKYVPHVESSTEELDVNTLDEPSSVLILKESEQYPESTIHRVVENELDAEYDTVEKQLNEEKVERAGAKEVLRNFDYIRSLHTPRERLSPEQWTDLRETLKNGFTHQQLNDYSRYFKTLKTAPTENDSAEPSPSDWRPGTSLFLELGPNAQEQGMKRASLFKGMDRKSKWAEKILRECWQLSVAGETGQLDIRLDPLQLSMLLVPKCNPLKSLAEANGAKIDVAQTLSLIRVTGTEHACYEVRLNIMDFILNIKSTTIDLGPPGGIFSGKDKQFDKGFLDWLQQEYGLFCRKHEQTGQLTIYYVTEGASEVEEARRTIDLIKAGKPKQDLPLSTYMPETELANMYPVINPESMTWVDGQKEWLRWSKVLLSTDTPEGRSARRPPDALYNSGNLSKISDLLFRQPNLPEQYRAGQPYVRETVVAAVGKCLFERGSKLGLQKMNFGDLERAKASRIFTTDLPNTRLFLKNMSPLPESVGKLPCRIRLVPSARNAVKLPVIELELEIKNLNSHTKWPAAPKLWRASAIMDETSADLLLPDTSLDLRFTRSTYFDFFDEGGEGGFGTDLLPGILRSAEELRYTSPLSSHQPSMPLTCQLEIPRGLLLGAEEAPDGMAEDSITSEYIFPPLKSLLSSSIARFIYRDMELNYTHSKTGPMLAQNSIDLTLGLGRRDKEVRPAPLKYGIRYSSADEGDTSLQTAFQNLYTSACRLAFELNAVRPENSQQH